MMKVVQSKNFKCAGSCALVFRYLFDLCFNILGKFILTVLYKLILAFDCVASMNSGVLSVFRTRTKTYKLHDETVIKNNVILLKKIPHHMTLIVSAESPSYEDLVNVIKWSIPAGISHVSFYHHHNGLESEVLFNFVCKHAKNYIPLIKWGKNFSEEIKSSSKDHINGFKWRPILTVHIYSGQDWDSAVLKSIEELSLSGCEDVSIERLGSLFHESFLAPDPDLAVVAGNALSFFGFPPWHIRITQIQKIPSHHNISLKTFIESLREYSLCEQRYGK